MILVEQTLWNVLEQEPVRKIKLNEEQTIRFLSCFVEEALEIAGRRIAEQKNAESIKSDS